MDYFPNTGHYTTEAIADDGKFLHTGDDKTILKPIINIISQHSNLLFYEYDGEIGRDSKYSKGYCPVVEYMLGEQK